MKTVFSRVRQWWLRRSPLGKIMAVILIAVGLIVTYYVVLIGYAIINSFVVSLRQDVQSQAAYKEAKQQCGFDPVVVMNEQGVFGWSSSYYLYTSKNPKYQSVVRSPSGGGLSRLIAADNENRFYCTVDEAKQQSDGGGNLISDSRNYGSREAYQAYILDGLSKAGYRKYYGPADPPQNVYFNKRGLTEDGVFTTTIHNTATFKDDEYHPDATLVCYQLNGEIDPYARYMDTGTKTTSGSAIYYLYESSDKESSLDPSQSWTTIIGDTVCRLNDDFDPDKQRLLLTKEQGLVIMQSIHELTKDELKRYLPD